MYVVLFSIKIRNQELFSSQTDYTGWFRWRAMLCIHEVVGGVVSDGCSCHDTCPVARLLVGHPLIKHGGWESHAI